MAFKWRETSLQVPYDNYEFIVTTINKSRIKEVKGKYERLEEMEDYIKEKISGPSTIKDKDDNDKN